MTSGPPVRLTRIAFMQASMRPNESASSGSEDVEKPVPVGLDPRRAHAKYVEQLVARTWGSGRHLDQRPVERNDIRRDAAGACDLVSFRKRIDNRCRCKQPADPGVPEGAIADAAVAERGVDREAVASALGA